MLLSLGPALTESTGGARVRRLHRRCRTKPYSRCWTGIDGFGGAREPRTVALALPAHVLEALVSGAGRAGRSSTTWGPGEGQKVWSLYLGEDRGGGLGM